MITGISGTNYVTAGGIVPSMPYINTNTLSAGQLRFNPQMNRMEVYDGSVWHVMPSAHATVDLPDWVKATLDWAHQRMTEERNLEYLCAKYPGLEKARNNYDLFKQFVKAQEDADNSNAEVSVTTGP